MFEALDTINLPKHVLKDAEKGKKNQQFHLRLTMR